MTLRDTIRDRGTSLTPVDVPEWDTTVHIKRLSFGEKVTLIDQLADQDDGKKLLYVVAVLHTACDQDGKLLFTPDDYDLVAGGDAAAVLRLGRVAVAVNKLIGDPVDEAKKG